MAKSTDNRTSNTKNPNGLPHNESLQLHPPTEAAVASSQQHLQVRRHRRSISQLMASMGNVSTHRLSIRFANRRVNKVS
ncbi:hypothetical protein KR018_006690, partial [Drosophila ironensis]